VMASQIQRILLLSASALNSYASAAAQIVSPKDVGGKTVMCIHSGLMSDLTDCGDQSRWYTYVFVGTISAITPAADDESELRIVPQEVFSGKPDNPVTVLTSQGLCLPKLTVGDQWLFYLRKETGKPIVLDYYGNQSVPVGKAQTEIDTLRRLQKIGNFGIVRGRVVRGKAFEGSSVRRAHITAGRTGEFRLYSAITDKDGRWEFQQLPPGRYVIKANASGLYRPHDEAIDLTPGACWDLTPMSFPIQ